MIRKHKYTIIAVIAVVILVLSLMTAALLSSRQDNISDISGGSFYAAAPAAIEHNFGKEPEGHTPEGQPISTEQELLSFFTNDVPKGYFRNSIVLSGNNVGAKLSNRVMNAGKVLDGNGFNLSMTIPGGGSWGAPNLVDVPYGDGVFVDVRQQDDNWRGSKVRASGGLLALNKGTIKNLNIIAEFTNNVYLDFSEKETVAVSPIIGVNAGFIQNVNVRLSGNYKFSMHKNDVTSNASYMRTLLMGGLVGMSSGVVEKVSLDLGIAEFEAQVKSANWHAHSILGGIIGKVMTSKVEKLGVEGVEHAIVRDLIITGNGTLNAYLTSGTNDGTVDVGAAIGNNQIKYPSSSDANNNESDPNKFGVGNIDGIINGFEGTYKNNAVVLGHKATIGCGVAGNILYAFSYNGSAAACGHSITNGAHNKVGHSVAANPYDAPQGSDLVIRIDEDKNEADADSFNITIFMTAPQDSEHLIYSADERTYKVSVTDNDKETDQSRTPIGGWARVNVNSEFDYWNTQTAEGAPANNYKSLEYSHSEAREKHKEAGAWDNTHTSIELVFGKEMKVGFGSTISQNMTFTNANPEIIVTNKAGSTVNVGTDELHYLSDFVSPDGGNGYEVNSLYMPGTYSNVRIVSEHSKQYGYIDLEKKLVAPLAKFEDHIGSDGAQINIECLDFTLTNAPQDGRIYNEFTFEYDITEPDYNGEYDSILSVLYGTNGMPPSTAADSLSSHTVNKSTRPSGNIYVFAGYVEYDPAAFFPGHQYREEEGPAPSVSTRLTDRTDESRLIIDKDAPLIEYCDAEGNTTSAPSLDEWQDTAVNVYFKVSDEHSANPSVTCAAAGVSIVLYPDEKGIYTLIISDNKEYSVTVEDSTGNSMTETIKLPIDRVDPQLGISGHSDGDSVSYNEDTPVEFNITVGGSGYVIEVSKDGGTTYEVLLDKASYTFDTNCEDQEYIFRLTTEVRGADGEFKSARFTLIVTMTKGVITLTNDAIVSTKGANYVGVKVYDGTTDVSDTLKADFEWNEASTLYNQLKDMQFEASFKTAIGIGGVGIEGGNAIIFKPIDPSGQWQFEGEIVYPHASITPRTVTIKIADAERQYGDINPQFIYDIFNLIDGEDESRFDTLKLITSAQVGSNAGTYAITLGNSEEELKALFKQYGYLFTRAGVEEGDLNVTKRVLDSDLHIDPETVNGVDYTGSAIAIRATYDFGGVTMPLEAKYYTEGGTELSGAPTNVGSYYAILQVPNDNFILSDAVRRYEIIIHEAYVIINVDGAVNQIINHKYSGEPYAVNYSIAAEGSVTVNYIDSDGNESDTAPTNVGEYKIGFRIIPADTNFKETYVEYTLNITRANFLTDAGTTFDNKKAEFSDEFIYLELLNAPIGSIIDIKILGIAPNSEYVIDNVNGTFSAISVGVYNVTLTLTNPNYEDLSIQAKLEITQAQMNIVFEGKQYVYDGTAHSIEVLGVPEGGIVAIKTNAVDEPNLTVENKNKLISAINAGRYAITATISCDGWVTQTLSAVLAITPAKMDGVTFTSFSGNYDGDEHTISVGGTLPADAKCSITVNNIRYDDTRSYSNTSAGVYRATASVSAPNYETLTIRSTLEIKPLNLRDKIDVSIFNVAFDGNAHAFVISLIDGISDVSVDVIWTGNGEEDNISNTISGSETISKDFINAGTYKFKITVRKENYITTTFNAEGIIREAQFQASFVGSANSVVYNGSAHVVALSNVPSGANVDWTASEGVIVDEVGLSFSAINAGSYSVMVNLSMENYADKKMTFKLTINGADIGKVIKYNKAPVFEWSPNGSEFQIDNLPAEGNIEFDISENTSGGIEVADGKIKVNNIGNYTVTFVITAPNYNTYTKRITISVIRASFTNTVVFEDKTVDYNGSGHSIELLGIPEGAQVTFMHDNNAIEPTADGRYIFTQTDAGGYIVHYTLKRDNYNNLEGSARLTINHLAMDTSKFDDYSAVYNGMEHTYSIMDKLPDGASYELLSDLPNGVVIADGIIKATNAIAGFRVQIRLTCPNYKNSIVRINFFIDRAPLGDLNVEDKNATFNEANHSVSISGVKDGDTVDITSQSVGEAGVSIDGNTFNAMHAGRYVIKFEVSRGENYKTFTKTVTLTINKAQLPGEFKFYAPETQWVEGGGLYTASVVNADGSEIDTAKYKVVWGDRGNVFVNAGTYALSARVESIGANSADYETYQVKHVNEESGEESSFINFVIKHAKMTDEQKSQIVMDNLYVEFNNNEHVINVKEPDGFHKTVSGNKLTNAGSTTAIATFTRANYEPVTVTRQLVITARKVKVEFIIMPSYVVGEIPLVIGRYMDIDENIINFRVDVSGVDYEVEGSYDIVCSSLGNRNYEASNEKEEMKLTVIIGAIKQDLNIGGIVGGSVGGSAGAIGGGIAALLIVLRKKKIRL